MVTTQITLYNSLVNNPLVSTSTTEFNNLIIQMLKIGSKTYKEYSGTSLHGFSCALER